MTQPMKPTQGKTAGKTSDTKRSENLKGNERIKKDVKDTGIHSKGSSQSFSSRSDNSK